VARGWDKGWDFLKILGWDLSRGAAEFFFKKVQGRRRGLAGGSLKNVPALSQFVRYRSNAPDRSFHSFHKWAGFLAYQVETSPTVETMQAPIKTTGFRSDGRGETSGHFAHRFLSRSTQTVESGKEKKARSGKDKK
jgi:hypothetical protein